MTKLTRTALAAFAAVGVIAATGVVGVASAAAADTVQTRSLEAAQLRDRGLPPAAGRRGAAALQHRAARVARHGGQGLAKLSAQIARLSTSGGGRLPVVEGPTIAEVKVTGTHGPAGDSLDTKAACQAQANYINGLIEEGFKELHGGNMAGAADKFGQAVKGLRDGEDVGCEFG
jgi:hypothetical protein